MVAGDDHRPLACLACGSEALQFGFEEVELVVAADESSSRFPSEGLEVLTQ